MAPGQADEGLGLSSKAGWLWTSWLFPHLQPEADQPLDCHEHQKGNIYSMPSQSMKIESKEAGGLLFYLV